MSRFEYDEEASQELHYDVVHEVDDRPVPVGRWVDAMRALNAIDDLLARKLLRLHRDCGSVGGPCDDVEREPSPLTERRWWGCETVQLIADHFDIPDPGSR